MDIEVVKVVCRILAIGYVCFAGWMWGRRLKLRREKKSREIDVR